MKFGYYSQVKDHNNSRVYADVLDEMRKEAIFCEEAGLDIVWPDEHHFHFGYHENTNPIVVGAMIAEHTSRIRIGLPVIPSNWQPLRLAEDIALLDQLSRGRVEVSMGRGASRFSVANINPELKDLWPDRKEGAQFQASAQTASRDHFAEVVEVMKKAWTQDSFSHEGRYYKFPQAGMPWDFSAPPKDPSWVKDGEIVKMSIGPKPFQKPHPPLRMLMHSVPSYAQAAEMDLKGWIWINPLKRLSERLQVYADGRSKREGREFKVGEDITALKMLYVAPTYEEAKRDADHILTTYLNGFGVKAPKNYILEEDEEDGTPPVQDWEFWRKRLMLIAGSPEQVAEQLYEVEERFDLDTIALYSNGTGPQGGQDILSHKQIMSSLDLFASKVLPLFANGKSGGRGKAGVAQQ